MIKNLNTQASAFTPALGKERSQQLGAEHRFFSIKRTKDLAQPNKPRPSKTMAALENADQATIQRKYQKVFG